jgi:hypothetical protein
MSQSDEEILEEMYGGGLPYRLGWPQLPSLPIETTINGARNSVENSYAILLEVQTILELQGVYSFASYFAYHVPRDANPPDNIEQYHTLVVEINSASPNTSASSFKKAIIRVRQLLKGHETTMNTVIEFIDYRARRNLFTRGIRHDDTTVLKAWTLVTNVIISGLCANNASWLCIEAGYCGLSEDQCSLTAIITSPTSSDKAWRRDILPALRLRLRSIVPVFEVELLCGVNLMSMNSEIITVASYSQEVTMGSSVGIGGAPRHAGTVGGFVKLANGHTFGLTNHHVVRDERIDTSKSSSGGLFS